MKNPLDSILGTIIAGLILTAILFFVAKNFLGGPKGEAKVDAAAVTTEMDKSKSKDTE